MTILARILGNDDRCVRFRPALIDWVEHRLESVQTPAAFDHLEQCRRCELELTEIAQTVIALRRVAARASASEPTEGWQDLRRRLETIPRRSRQAGRSRWGLAGSMLAPVLLAVLALRSAVTAAPVGEVLVDDGVGRPAGISSAVRQMYESDSRPLTEGIVLVLSGRGQPPDGRFTWPAIAPSSTDRRDVPPAVRRAATQSAMTPPRSATRS